MEVKNATALASACEDAEGLVRKITLLEGDLAQERQARKWAEENSHGLSDVAADAKCRWEVSEREHREQFEEFNLLEIQGSELCHAIVSPPRVRNHLLEGMRLAALHHTEMDGELATLQMEMFYATESVLVRSPNEIFPVEIVGELVAKF
jgi:hypothetical protein